MSNIGARKAEHLEITLNKKVEEGYTWLDDVILVHEAAPEVDLHDIDTSVEFLGKKMKVPIHISGMTGGVKEASVINKGLAKVAYEKGLGFGVGSQRAMLKDPSVWDTFYVRDVNPDGLVLGNMGAVNLHEYPGDEVFKAFKKIGADAMAIHLNPAQEAVQPEGDWDFSRCMDEIKKLSGKIDLVAKEVGNGMSRETAFRLKKVGIKGIDVGGRGGTSWVKVEEYRKGISTPYTGWGIPTAASLLECSSAGLPMIATGGIRRGLDVAKTIALGATMAGMALPMFKWWEAGVINEEIDGLVQELKVAMFLTGSNNIQEFQNCNLVIVGKLREWCDARGIDVKKYANRRI